jgi:L-malate glycosyltransferase
MQITFVLPKLIKHPVGGYKVHYQYANALAERGHKVTLVHPASANRTPHPIDEFLTFSRSYAEQRILGIAPVRWFEFHSNVRIKLIPLLRGSRLPAADVTILTGWQTAEVTGPITARAGRLFQIVYDFEHWKVGTDDRSRIGSALSRSDVRQIATSKSVASMLCEIGRPPIATVTAGLQENEFTVDSPISNRRPIVGFPLRVEAAKDMATAFAATKRIRQALPGVEVQCFGVGGPEVPPEVNWVGRLDADELKAFYNSCSVFLLTSLWEGWGLPAAEAMACGAAVVSTRNGGTEDFIIDNVNGLLVPVADPEAVADAVLRLLNDEATRFRLAEAGSISAASRTAQDAAVELETILF